MKANQETYIAIGESFIEFSKKLREEADKIRTTGGLGSTAVMACSYCAAVIAEANLKKAEEARTKEK